MRKIIFCILMLIPFGSGCGYTTKTVLPNGIKTIYVKTTYNDIPIDRVIAYQPGMEIQVTNAIIRRFHEDGNLKVVKEDEADAILETKLIGYDQEGLRFSRLESVQEYRLYITLAFKLVNAKTGSSIMEENGFTGQTDYFVSGVSSVAREDATQQAIVSLAHNVVDRIVEDW